MTAVAPERTSGTRMDSGEDIKAMDTIRRGMRISPELREGFGFTLFLAVIASCGQVVVPIAVQQTLDRGLNGPGGPDVSFVVWMGVLAAAAIALTSAASYLMTMRLFTTSERGLATLRIKAFRHVHDLPLLTQNTERRGALVSRVTTDVDQVSQFLVFGGLLFIVSIGQMLVATVIMVVYSWQLALVVWVAFAPLFLSIRYFQRKLSEAYGVVRHQVGVLLGAISEPVVGAAVVRSYAVEDRTQDRIDTAIDDFKAASIRAQQFTVVSFSLGGISAGLANACVLIVGVWLGFTGDMTPGRVLAFAFLVTLFVGPVQMGTQILTDAQNAIASWRRVIGILETPADLVDPGPDGEVLPRGPIDIRFQDVTFSYPDGPPVLRDIDMAIAAGSRVAIVGETGSGKSTFAKLLTRLMDVDAGAVLLDGVDVRTISSSSLRRSVVLVPQEGFLFDDTITANVRYGRLEATEAEILASADELGLRDWLDGLPRGMDTMVGQRGESLSAGERQLVALLRAHLVDPDLLVLDEATSAVDPALEMRIGRALERLMSGRTSVTIAHRLTTAENADEVVVVDRGPDRPARTARSAGPRGGQRLRRPALLLGRPARLSPRAPRWSSRSRSDRAGASMSRPRNCGLYGDPGSSAPSGFARRVEEGWSRFAVVAVRPDVRCRGAVVWGRPSWLRSRRLSKIASFGAVEEPGFGGRSVGGRCLSRAMTATTAIDALDRDRVPGRGAGWRCAIGGRSRTGRRPTSWSWRWSGRGCIRPTRSTRRRRCGTGGVRTPGCRWRGWGRRWWRSSRSVSSRRRWGCRPRSARRSWGRRSSCATGWAGCGGGCRRGRCRDGGRGGSRP